MKIKPIKDFPRYFVTDTGKVFSTMPRANQPPPSQPREKSFFNCFGYWCVSLSKGKKEHKKYVHRLVLETFRGKAPKGYQCRHLDGVRTNNNINNLKWGTRSENQMDRVAHGSSNRGERHPHHKLTEEQVRLIYKLATDANKKTRKIDKGGNYAVIAKMFNVSRSAIEGIVRRKSWKHLPLPNEIDYDEGE